MLDGGHLMYYLWEWLTGHPPGAQALRRMQFVGLWMIGFLTMLALFNDLSRYLP
jgi:regulator of sigma E protease